MTLGNYFFWSPTQIVWGTHRCGAFGLVFRDLNQKHTVVAPLFPMLSADQRASRCIDEILSAALELQMCHASRRQGGSGSPDGWGAALVLHNPALAGCRTDARNMDVFLRSRGVRSVSHNRPLRWFVEGPCAYAPRVWVHVSAPRTARGTILLRDGWEISAEDLRTQLVHALAPSTRLYLTLDVLNFDLGLPHSRESGGVRTDFGAELQAPHAQTLAWTYSGGRPAGFRRMGQGLTSALLRALSSSPCGADGLRGRIAETLGTARVRVSSTSPRLVSETPMSLL